MTAADRRPLRALAGSTIGIEFDPEHFDAIVDTRPDLGFFEVHAENYMGAGGAPHRRLDAIRERYPLSLHGVGLSIGSPGPLDRAHLQRLAAVAKRFEPTLVSEHLAWSTHEGAFLNDLLPLPYTDETVGRISEHIDEVQNALGGRCCSKIHRPMSCSQKARGRRRTSCAKSRGEPAAVPPRHQQRVRQRRQSWLRPRQLSRRFSAGGGRRDPPRGLGRRQRRRGPAAADRRPQFAGSRRCVGALCRDDPPARGHADAHRVGQRCARLDDASSTKHGAPNAQ